MASYIRSWLYTQQEDRPTFSNVPDIIEDVAPSNVDNDDDTETIHGDHNDSGDNPPAFPSLNSAQRVASKSQATNAVPRILSDSRLMPPPPVPSMAARRPGVPTSSGSLAVPLTTVKPPSKSSGRNKVALAPGHGPLDWANLKKSGEDLRVRWIAEILSGLSLICYRAWILYFESHHR